MFIIEVLVGSILLFILFRGVLDPIVRKKGATISLGRRNLGTSMVLAIVQFTGIFFSLTALGAGFDQ